MLLDTSGFFALIDEDDSRHELARQLYEGASVRLTHSYILAELIPLAGARGLPRQLALGVSEQILNDTKIETIWVNKLLHARALELLDKRTDKAYSLCDAMSFILMRERRLTDALTTDKHFEQEGFVRLLI
jgi:uncharacterized protein